MVALYSQVYFGKDLCQWELHRALMLQQYEGTKLIPVLIDPAAAAQVPYVASKIHWLPVTRPDWFGELRELLGLLPTAAGSRRALRFVDSVPDVLVNHTLPEVRVTITGADGAPVQQGGELVTLTAEPATAGLSGTRSVSAVAGTARFTDLSFTAAVPEVRLAASAPGCDPVLTPSFRVRPLARRPAAEPGGIRTVLAASGLPVFFPDGRTLAALDGGRLTVHPAAGRAPTRPGSWKRPGYGPAAPATWRSLTGQDASSWLTRGETCGWRT